jgi:hypothetical protein
MSLASGQSSEVLRSGLGQVSLKNYDYKIVDFLLSGDYDVKSIEEISATAISSKTKNVLVPFLNEDFHLIQRTFDLFPSTFRGRKSKYLQNLP